MSTNLTAPLVAATATFVAALIAAAVSFVNLTLTKEQKTSEFRQAWIDELRKDLAALFATVRAFARASQELAHFGKGSKDGAPMAITEEKISDLRYQLAETRYRILLRLNAKEPEHIELLRLIGDAVENHQRALEGQGGTEETLKAVDAAAEYARQVLKSEWERVKRGELPFRIVRNLVAPIIFILSIVFVGLILTETVQFGPAFCRSAQQSPLP